MLVISRKTEECLKIGNDIVVKVIKTSNGSVKIGIEAPGGMRILRGELVEESAELPRTGRHRSGTLRDQVEFDRIELVEAV